MKQSMPSPFLSMTPEEFNERFGKEGIAKRIPWSVSQLKLIRKHFPDAELIYANEGGYEVGEPLDGVPIPGLPVPLTKEQELEKIAREFKRKRK